MTVSHIATPIECPWVDSSHEVVDTPSPGGGWGSSPMGVGGQLRPGPTYTRDLVHSRD